MTKHQKRRLGRHRYGVVQKAVMLREEDIELGRELGDGNMSLGIRRALLFVRYPDVGIRELQERLGGK